MGFTFWIMMVISVALVVYAVLMILPGQKEEKEKGGRILRIGVILLILAVIAWIAKREYGWTGNLVVGFLPSVMIGIAGLFLGGILIRTKKIGWVVVGTIIIGIMLLAAIGRLTWYGVVNLNLDYLLSEKVFPWLLIAVAFLGVVLVLWGARRILERG